MERAWDLCEEGMVINMNICEIIRKQRVFFETGTTKQIGFRMAALIRLEQALIAWEPEIKEALWLDLHKSDFESYMAEIALVKEEIKFVKKHLAGWAKPHPVNVSLSQLPARTFSIAEPYGDVLIMAPWNYPVLLCLNPLVDAIAAGNCVVLKPSAYAPHVSSILKDMLGSIYPSKFVAVMEGGRTVNSELLEQRFDYIFFTGGVEVGRLVLEKAAVHLTPATLELGGKSPCIVDETADLSLAARKIVFGKIINAGQTCVAPDYILVKREKKDALLDCLKKELICRLGNAPLDNPDYPSIVNEHHFNRLLGLIQGESIAWGGRFDTTSHRIAPVILDDVTLNSPVMQEEIFGPIFPVIAYDNHKDLQRIIHHFEKPLAFYLFTKKRAMKDWALREFSFGGGCINDTILHLTSPTMPFGGVGGSGMGSYHGEQGFETFSHRKSIVDKCLKFDNPLRYHPYTEIKDMLLHFLL